MHYAYDLLGGRMFSCTVEAKETCFYYFRVEGDGECVWYGNNQNAWGGFGDAYAGVPDTLYQITVYDERYKTPASFRGGIVYQIFPDRFCRGENAEKKDALRAWGDTPYFTAEQFGGTYTADDFFGGTLWGVAEKLPYLKAHGITHIYLNPIFASSSNHGYNTRDYEVIEERLGGDEAFDYLILKAREEGISVILDGVFSHTGHDSRYFQSAQESEQSPYRAWYTFHDGGYDAWWGMPTLPNVVETEPSYMDFMLTGDHAVVKKWLRRGAAGWRLDVADELPDPFLDALRRVVKAENAEAVILGEVWEDASIKISYGQRRRYLTGAQLDGVMNYPLRAAILDFVLRRETAEVFRARVLSLLENYPPPALYASLNILSSHDVPRLLTVLGEAPATDDKNAQSTFRLSPEKRALAKARLPLALLLQMAMPGVPCIYYGDEAGVEGYGDPFNRTTFPWGNEDKAVQAIFWDMLRLRKEKADFCDGDLRFLYAAGDVVVFCRGNTRVFVNVGNEGQEITLFGETVILPPMEGRTESFITHKGDFEDENYNA